VTGQPTAAWLKAAADRSFAGNPRSRMAEAVVNLALGSPLHHRLLGAEGGVELQVAVARRSAARGAGGLCPDDRASGPRP
jgi:hypothetical protein